MREVHPNSAALDRTAANSGSFDYSSVYEQVLRLQKENRSDRPQDKAMTELNQKLHSQGIIPNIDITGADKEGHFTGRAHRHEVKVVASDIRAVYQPGQSNSRLQGAANIGSELYNGVYDEVAHHKDRLLISAGSGLGLGFAVDLAATPVVATALMALGLGYGGYQIYKHLPGWIRDAKVTANPQLYSHTEVEKAHQGVEGFGAGALDLGVGMVAGMAGGYAGRAVKIRSAHG